MSKTKTKKKKKPSLKKKSKIIPKKKNSKSTPKKKPLYPNPNSIKGALRRLFSRSPIVFEVREKAVHPTKKGVRGGKQYICSVCKNTFPGKEIQVHHKIPVIPLNKTIHDISYDTLVKRLFCKKSNLVAVCKECHSELTKKEKEERKKWKEKQKKKNSTHMTSHKKL